MIVDIEKCSCYARPQGLFSMSHFPSAPSSWPCVLPRVHGPSQRASARQPPDGAMPLPRMEPGSQKGISRVLRVSCQRCDREIINWYFSNEL